MPVAHSVRSACMSCVMISRYVAQKHLSMPFGTRPLIGDPPMLPGAAKQPRRVFRTRCGSCGSTFTAAPPSSALRQDRTWAVRLWCKIRHRLLTELYCVRKLFEWRSLSCSEQQQ